MLQVPALNLSSVGRESPTKSPSRALQPAEFDSNSGTALVFKQPKKVNPRSKQHFCHIKVLCKRFLLDVIYDAWKLQAMHRLPQQNGILLCTLACVAANSGQVQLPTHGRNVYCHYV